MMAAGSTQNGSYFTIAGEKYVPTDYAQSEWSADMINGQSVVGAAARQLEIEYGRAEFQPARLTVDLLAPARIAPVRISTSLVRDGNRIRVADAYLTQGDDDKLVARASLIQLRRGDQPPGELWHSARAVDIPPQCKTTELAPLSQPLVDGSLGGPRWTTDLAVHQGAGRKRYWHHPLDVVDFEPASPFQKAAVVAEATSLVANWGSEGVGFINTDLTLSLARLPTTNDFGIEGDEHLSATGVGVGTATLFDREGPFGVGAVVALGNARRLVDFGHGRLLLPIVGRDGH